MSRWDRIDSDASEETNVIHKLNREPEPSPIAYWDTQQLLATIKTSTIGKKLRLYRVTKKSWTALNVRVVWEKNPTKEFDALALSSSEWKEFGFAIREYLR
jgi:hypothetical protein